MNTYSLKITSDDLAPNMFSMGSHIYFRSMRNLEKYGKYVIVLQLMNNTGLLSMIKMALQAGKW